MIIFVLVLGLTLFIGNRIKNSLDDTFLGKVDSFAGAALGITKYAFCVSVLIWLATALKLTLPSNWVAGSYLYPWVAKVAQNMSGWAGDMIPFFKEIFKEF
jgi:uncharacterized membrane protein required for colicin V production